MAAAKRNLEEEALPKQHRTHEEVAIPRLLNPPPPPELTIGVPPFGNKHVKPRHKSKSKRSNRKSALQEHVEKYNVIAEISIAPSGLTFVQLIRGDGDVAKNEISRLFTKRSGGSRAYAVHADTKPRRLRLVNVREYGTDARALFDSDAVPNTISLQLVSKLCLSPQLTGKKITLADGGNAPCQGTLPGVPKSFGDLTVNLDYLLVKGTPFDLIIGLPSLEELKACIDLGSQNVRITVGDKTMRLGLTMDVEQSTQNRSSTDSEDFTSDPDSLRIRLPRAKVH